MARAGKRKQEAASSSGATDKKIKNEETPVEAEKDMGEFEQDSEDVGEDSEEEFDDDGEEEEEEGEENEKGAKAPEKQSRIWRPGIDEIGEDEHLEPEPGTYDMLHRANVEWPCLSFDILRDDLGANRSDYPMSVYVVAGTQAKHAADNRLYMMKWHQLHKTLKDGMEDDDDQSEDSGEDENDDKEAKLEYKVAVHPGGVNRVRAMPQAPHIVMSWADTGKVHVWNLQNQRKALDKSVAEKVSGNVKPMHTCDAHKEEGFALDWNPHTTGRVLTGSNDGVIYLWEPVQGGWNVGADKPFSCHTGSVEDVQWRRTGSACEQIFASCSSDQSICIWDARQNRKKPTSVIADAHGGDVNVISWSPCVGELLMSGSDDGGFKIWDTRHTGSGAMANFLWHRKPITSVDWHPTDETVLAVASEDNSVSLWDMAVEDDRPEGHEQIPGEDHFPAQLLFLHMGQKDIKEIRWHHQIPGVCISTAASGFNVFKTCNI